MPCWSLSHRSARARSPPKRRFAVSSTPPISAASGSRFDAFLVDLRFERAPEAALIGGVEDTANRLFGGDRARALRWLKDQQGTLVLAELRRAGHAQPAVFVHDFPRQRLENLRRLYGDVRAVPGFDAAAIRAALDLPPGSAR